MKTEEQLVQEIKHATLCFNKLLADANDLGLTVIVNNNQYIRLVNSGKLNDDLLVSITKLLL